MNKKCIEYGSIDNKMACLADNNCMSSYCNASDMICYDAPKSANSIPVNCNSGPSKCESVSWTNEGGNI